MYSDTFTMIKHQSYGARIFLYGDGNDWQVYIGDGKERYYFTDGTDNVLTPTASQWTEYVLDHSYNRWSSGVRFFIVAAEGNTNGTLYVDEVGLFQNLAMEGDAEFDSNWADVLTPTTHDRSAVQAHGGTYSRRVIVDSVG
ncbi:MAG: hypothetical protein ACW96U_00005, partial [Candidatus Heimdallarchaeaceae archaeon]